MPHRYTDGAAVIMDMRNRDVLYLTHNNEISRNDC